LYSRGRGSSFIVYSLSMLAPSQYGREWLEGLRPAEAKRLAVGGGPGEMRAFAWANPGPVCLWQWW